MSVETAATPEELTTLGLWNIAGLSPDRTALVGPSGDEVSYGTLASEANRYARGLRAMGLRTGDVVVVMMPNCVELLAVYFAAYQTGLYIVAVNWHLAAPEISYILSDSDAGAFVAHQRFADTATAAADDAEFAASARFAVGDIPGFADLADLAAGQSDARPDERTTGSPMLYTSGTTGRPKGVRRPLTGADPDEVPVASTGFFALFGIEPFDGHVHLCGSPLYHTAVLNFVVISIQLGHPAVLMDKWDPEEMLRLIQRYRVTHSHMVPTQFRRLLALPERTRLGYDVSSLRTMIHGAAPCPNEVKRQMLDWWGPVVTEYYAATEGGGTTITGEEWLRKPGSVGRPWPNSTVRILDEQGDELDAGEVGMVYMRMGGSEFEYHKDRGKTESSRVGNLFTLGDVGYLDADGYLFLKDRKNDMIISGGVNIYPAKIEGELAAHPKVADVAVFGVPHEDWGEEVKAVVAPADGAQPGPGLTEELLTFLRDRLARFKLPRSIDYREELPRDPNGKLYKRQLRDPYWAGTDRAI